MSTVLVNRSPRRPAPPVEKGDFPLQEPPGLPESSGSQLSGLLMMLPMALMTGAMMLIFIQPGSHGPLALLAGGAMGVAIVAMLLGQLLRGSTDRKHRLKGERRDYLRYLGQVRSHVRKTIDQQREAVFWTHPDPARLWTLVRSDRLWERRASHPDFAEVRLGLGPQRLAMKLVAPQTKPVEDLEPLAASALRRFLRAYTAVDGMPIAVYLRGFARLSLDGDRTAILGLTRALLAQLATLHAPDDLRIAVCAGPDRLAGWDWLKWLPHAQHPSRHDALGPVRLIGESWPALEELLGDDFADRGRHDHTATPSSAEPYVVVVLDGPELPANSRLGGPGYRNMVALDLAGTFGWTGDSGTLRLSVTPDEVRTVQLDRRGVERATALGRPDALPAARARALVRQLAPYRVGTASGPDLAGRVVDLLDLLGVADPRTLNPADVWRDRSGWDHLRVPIGRTEHGDVVELDLKESAQGGMGPHGILIGATGSGKSELIRTLVLALALAHSSERLNLILVDFKGGATFLNLGELPHVSALITNLADELPLVDRMQDAIAGELVRRQELLRKHGHSSIQDYVKARDGGAELPNLATLVIIVDEFAELLASKAEFMELFVMIGRLGRSLGVHLLLASQRLDEGRIHNLEGHLSYRMGLRMFTAAESRAVLGTVDAYDKPLPPGTGYLRTDTTTLVKFKGAFVSAPHRNAVRRTPRAIVDHQVALFTAGYRAPVERPAVPEPVDETPVETILQVVVDRLSRSGPPAHPVWLPPLTTPSTVDELLPPLAADPVRGFGTGSRSLVVPVALVDRPYEQRRDVLRADLAGGKGNVAVVGALQAGKSTVLRTLLLGLALSNTPREAQFYALDFGGALATLAGLPHTGAVAGRLDRDRVVRTVHELAGLLAHREQVFTANQIDSIGTYRKLRAAGQFADDPYGDDVFLVVDGWFTMRQEFDTLEPLLQDLATRGLTYGIHLLVSANRWSEIRPWLRDMLRTRFELRLADPMDSEVDFRAARTVPEQPGRGMTADKFHYLAALPRLDGRPSTDDLVDAGHAVVEGIREAWTGPAAPPVRLLPTRLLVDELPPAEPGPKLAIGLDEQRLAPVWHDFGTVPHLLIFGDTETGKSNLLRHVARTVTTMYSPDEARILCADPRRQLHDAVPASHQLAYALNSDTLADVVKQAVPPIAARVPGPDITPDRLSTRDWWTGPRLFVLIDDYDLLADPMNSPLAGLVGLAAQGAEIGLHIVLARTTSNAMRAMSEPLIRRLYDLATPALLLSCRREEGQFLGDAKPLVLPRGRAQLVSRRDGVRLVQTPLLPEAGGTR